MADRIEVFAVKLGDPNLDSKTKLNHAIELRDHVELFCSGSLYPHFLRRLMPIFHKLLETPPVFHSSSWNQRLRNTVLDLIYRLPMTPTDTVKPYLLELIDLLLDLVRVENEDNAVLCIKAVLDIQRNQTAATESRVKPFLEVIEAMFDGMAQTVQDTFGDGSLQNAGGTAGSTAGGAAAGSTPGNSAAFQSSPRPSSPSASTTSGLDIGGLGGGAGDAQQAARPLARGMQSFKVLAECPIIVVSLLQAHKNLVQANVRQFVPRIKGVLMAQAPPQQLAHQEAERRGEIFVGVSPGIKNRAAFGDFVTAQVKTMSFLAYLLRAYTRQLDDFLPALPNICIRMLRDCPSERSATRKELLVAIRHIINFNFRDIFKTKVNDLLDERTLIGDGLTVYETMRPLAYSMLADLIHHIRDELKPDQIQRTIEIFSKNMVEDFPGTSFQTMCAKLLLGMADAISNLENKETGRHFLIMIMHTIADKFALMNKEYPNAVKLSKMHEQQSISAVREEHLADPEKPPDWDETDIFYATPIKTSIPRDPTVNPVEDNKFLFKNLMTGLKSLFFRLKWTNPEVLSVEPGATPPNWKDASHSFTAEEVEVITRLFYEGARVFRYYSLEAPPSETPYASPIEYWANFYMIQSGKEERELLETFATAFHCVDPATFHEVFQTQIPQMYDMMFEHTALLHIPQFFLASEATSPSFAGMLLQFLMDRIGDVGSGDIKKSSILLRMFKLSFMAVTLFSAQNEQVLLPHVTKLVTKAIQLSTTADEPLNYFFLLRSLFRSIGGGRFELLYKEILPLLEMLLEVLNNLLNASRKPTERHLYVELCLTVPARLSNLLPHLSYLMRPLVVALRADGDLVGQGLRTLELCVDNLTADYLDPIMAPVMEDLMQALWDHLWPAPYNHFHSHTTMRILGKLGGRNRKFLTNPARLDFRPYADDEPSYDVRLIGSPRDRAFPARIGVDIAVARLHELPKTPVARKADEFYKPQALRFVAAQIRMHIGADTLPEDLPSILRLQANDLVEGNAGVALDFMERSERDKSIAKRDAQEETLKTLLRALIFACTLPELKATATALLVDVCRHFTILDLGMALARLKHKSQPFNPTSGEGPLCIDGSILGDAIAESLSSDEPEVRDAAVDALRNVHDTATTLFGSTERASHLPMFSQLARSFCHNCFEEDWYTKAGGALGIATLNATLTLPDAWMAERQIDFFRALLFLIRDVPADLPVRTRTHALETMTAILQRCNRGAAKADLENRDSALHKLCSSLSLELLHMHRQVREAAQAALGVLAACAGAEPWELVAPLKDVIMQPIYNKPLRALAFPVQIGYIEAVTYFLRLGHGIVEYNESLNRLIVETLALTDAEDESLATKPTEYRTAELLVQLRVSCVGLLTTALKLPDDALTAGAPADLRKRIIAVFFKSLYSSSEPVIDAAFEGFKSVLTGNNKLPKDLLQSGLRPLLMNLQDVRKLSVATLDGLARLLKLLTTHFKAEIGDRLLHHVDVLAANANLQRVSFTLIEQNRDMRIVAASFNAFHLLPATAVGLLPRFVAKVLELEERLRRTRRSPFRAPLLRYLTRYPRETWEFFAPRLADLRHGRFLAQLLANQDCGKLRQAVAADVDKLVQLTLAEPPAGDEAEEGSRTVHIINGIHIFHALTQYETAWFVGSDASRTALLEAGKALHARQKQREVEPYLRLPAHRAGEQVLAVLIAYLKAAPNDMDFLFRVVECVAANELRMLPAFKSFLYHQVICHPSPQYQRTVVLRCIDLYTARGTPQKMKTFLFHFLVNPILAMDVMNGLKSAEAVGAKEPGRLMDKSLLDAIQNKLWRPQLGDTSDDAAQPGVDHSRLELLQMSALILKHHHALVTDTRKDVIKFAWSYLRLEDTINKHAAYVLIAFFIAQFESPSKIVTQVYVALLRAHQNEGRALVVQALDLIAPVLPRRLQGPADAHFPIWARWPKRILSEENSNLQQLICVLNFMMRNPALFYEAREHFVPTVIQNLNKLATPPSPSNDSKKMALNAIELIRDWETRRIKGAGAAVADMERVPSGVSATASPDAKRRVAAEEPTSSVVGSPLQPPALTGPTSGDKGEYQIPLQLRMQLIKYLATLMSTFIERYPVPAAKLRELHAPASSLSPTHVAICKKAFALFFDLLSPGYWTDLELDLFPRLSEAVLASDKTDKALAAEAMDRPDDKNVAYVINTLQIMRVILHFKSPEWILGQMQFIQHILEKCLRADSAEIQDCLHAADLERDNERAIKPLLRSVLDALPTENTDEDDMEVETPATEFLTFLSNTATEALVANNFVAGLNILWTLAQVRPQMIDQQVPHVMRALQQKLMKDHLAAQIAQPGPNPQQAATAAHLRPGEQAPGPPDAREAELQVQLLLKGIEILALRMGALGEQRRPFLSVLASLVEKSPDVRLCGEILRMVEGWIFASSEPWPTLKEKTAVLHKMLNFEARADPGLLHRFLDLVIRIYEDPKITRTELTVRLEHAFLVGTRAKDVGVRNRFMNIFDKSLTRTAPARLLYVLTSQNWDTLAETCWLNQAIQLIFGSVDLATPAQLHADDFRMIPASQIFRADDARREGLLVDDRLEELVEAQRRFGASVADVRTRELLEPLVQLQHSDNGETAQQIWATLFPMCWATLAREDRGELEKGLVGLLTKDYHQRQIDRRPNVVQSLLEGVVRARPRVRFPPHVLKFLAKTYDAWYPALVALEDQVNEPLLDTPTLRESNLDALLETYAGLEESDLYYGTWRRRCRFVETNAALSYEQMGMWDRAQGFYDQAQIKARTGVVPFSQGEYMLWEDHWLVCAQKLQQWDVLLDFAKHENFNDLLLEASYRNFEMWTGPENLGTIGDLIKGVSDAPTPRRMFFQAFMGLLKFYDNAETQGEFNRTCDEAMQLSIRKWHQLPKRITNAHIPILQGFQQLIELHDAQLIFQSLHGTNAANLDAKSQELKLLLGTWRDRLPNVWDDINAWQSLVTWRQHIFQQINKTYLGLIQAGAGTGAGAGAGNNTNGNSYAYRGYHETAWIINRFAHVARKHQLPDVCISQLSKIYTLPNIEIQEAFLKLREQAKCHYQNATELANGLDVINNTNLNYFNQQQKAEFFTLRGMFHAKLGSAEEAHQAFGTALNHDIHLPKAWAEWGCYNDAVFKAEPANFEKAAAAVSCYLEAASLFKNAKARKLLGRVLWLLSIDSAEGTVARAFEECKAETPTWYWITFIPQLLTSLAQREARIARGVLIRIAKLYPQALYFHLRTNREDMAAIKRSAEQKMEKLNQQKQQQQQQQSQQQSQQSQSQPQPQQGQGSPGANVEQGTEANGTERPKSTSRPGTANGGDTAMANSNANGTTNGAAGGTSASPKREDGQAGPEEPKKEGEQMRKPWEHSEDIMQILKTAFPLLALSMETMVDQIQKHFKCPPDEDAYRLIVALLNDGLAYIGRVPNAYAQDYKLPPGTEANIRKFAETILPPHIRSSFEEDFVAHKPTMHEYIQKLRKWRDKFEEKLDRRARRAPLESFSPHLSEFQFAKFDDVEVPGQYLQHRDKNADFVRIERFLPDVDLVRTVGFSHRRLRVRGTDGSVHTFAVQHPAARHSRREERTLQLFRIFNGALAKRKEARRRGLAFHLPLMVPLAPSIRLVQEEAQYVSLQGVYEDHCRRHGTNKDDPVLFTMERLRSMADGRSNNLRMEVLRAVQEKWVPNTVALAHFQATHAAFADFWLFRRQFAHALAALTFMTYALHMTARYPHKLAIARASGSVWGAELIPNIGNKCLFHNPEPVPFRLTPNLQALLGPLGTEGPFAAALMALARCLTEPEGELEHTLGVFVRDEVMFWATSHRANLEGQLRERVQANAEAVVRKALALARPAQGTLPAHQTIIDTISAAVDPMRLAQADALWMPYL